MYNSIIQDEVARIHASETISEFEKEITSDIMIWGYSENERRIEANEPLLKFDSFEALCKFYWDMKLR